MAGEYTILLSDGVTSFTIHPLETDGQSTLSTPRLVQTIDLTGGAGINHFKLYQDLTYRFVAGFQFTVQLSGGADGVYTVAPGGSTFSGGLTTIPVVEVIPSAGLPFGQIVYSIPPTTTLALSGKGNVNYGEGLISNLVRMLENAANDVAPSPAIRGQLWFDTNFNIIRIYDGFAWIPSMGSYVLKIGDIMSGTLDMGSQAGYQTINYAGVVDGVDPTGLTNDPTVYTATVTVDGTPVPISVTGSAAQTFTDLVNEINTDLGVAASATIIGGNIRITSATTGPASSVSISDVDLFSSTTGFVSILAAVPGGPNNFIVNVLDPVNPQDAATKNYIDTALIVPLNEIVYGTGTGISSSPDFIVDTTTYTLIFNENQNPVSAPGYISLTGAFADVGTNANGGYIFLEGGAGDGTGAGGNIALQAGNSGDDHIIGGYAGSITLEAGESGTNSGNGGYIELKGGLANSPTGDGGYVLLQAGDADDSGNGGSIFITAGASSVGIPGNIEFSTDNTSRLTITETGEWNLAGDVGAANEILMSNGLGTPPTWETVVTALGYTPVNQAGDTMGGNLSFASTTGGDGYSITNLKDAANPLDAVNLQTADGLYVKLLGDTMAGDLNFDSTDGTDGFKIINLKDAAGPLEALNQKSGDARYGRLTTVNQWTGQQYFPTFALTDAANVSWDLDVAQVASLTLTALGTRQLDNPTNMKNGAVYILRISTGAGAEGLTFGTAYKWPGGTPPTITATAGALDILTFTSDGTNMYGIAQQNFS